VKHAEIKGEHAKHENIENNPQEQAIRIHGVSVLKKESYSGTGVRRDTKLERTETNLDTKHPEELLPTRRGAGRRGWWWILRRNRLRRCDVNQLSGKAGGA
jgi:hypothetical protein